MFNKVQIFNKQFSIYIKHEIPWFFLKFVLKAFYSDQAFLRFFDTCSTFLNIEEEYDKKFQFII